MNCRVVLPALLTVLFLPAAVRAEEKKVTFESNDSLAGWTVTGDVTIDPGKTREGVAGGSLKIGPGGRGIWKLGDKETSGKIEFYVYDDGAVADFHFFTRFSPLPDLRRGTSEAAFCPRCGRSD